MNSPPVCSAPDFGARIQVPLERLIRRGRTDARRRNHQTFNTGLVEEFRANGGKVGDKYKGANLSLLTTTGAKTGQPRITPLAYFRFDGKLIIIGSSWGAQSHPAWVRNLWANPSVHVEVGTESFDAMARELPAAEREPVWAQVVATAPVFREYQGRTDRVIPLFELQRHQG